MVTSILTDPRSGWKPKVRLIKMAVSTASSDVIPRSRLSSASREMAPGSYSTQLVRKELTLD